jgi:hypothetical protein
MLADSVKDRSAMSMFPAMAETWKKQADAESGWAQFQKADLQRLKGEFGVNWVVLNKPGIAGLDCPHQNSSLMVCRVD